MLSKPIESTGGNSIDDGVYLSEGKIIKVVDKSTHPDYPNREVVTTKKGEPVEILLEVTYKDGDTERTKKIFGAYEKDKIDGTITDWRTWGNEALIFVWALLSEETIAKGVSKSGAIQQSLLDAFVGKVYKEVRYVSGEYRDSEGKEKMSMSCWKYFPYNISDDAIKDQWFKAKGKIKNYKVAIYHKIMKPNSMDAIFPYGDNAPKVDPDDIM